MVTARQAAVWLRLLLILLKAECPSATEIAVRGTRETRCARTTCKPKMLIFMALKHDLTEAN